MRAYAPVFVLLFLSPMIAEILLGATPVSRIGGLVVLVFFYGGGAVIIRELARRRGPGWWRIVLLGVAYGIVEEGLVIQSLFNPDLFQAGLIGGRAVGVNWVWSEWTVGYHAVFSILIPILLTELLFPTRKDKAWLGWKGLTITGVAYVLSAMAIGAFFRSTLAPGFRAPPTHLIGASLVALALAALAILAPAGNRVSRPGPVPGRVPPPWLAGVLAFLVAAAWFHMLMLPPELKTGVRVLIPILSVAALAMGLAACLRWWSNREVAWTGSHRLALVAGAILPVMLFGFFAVTASKPVDQIGQGIASLVAIGLLATFAISVRRHAAAQPVS
jgi:hypothetical protein